MSYRRGLEINRTTTVNRLNLNCVLMGSQLCVDRIAVVCYSNPSCVLVKSKLGVDRSGSGIHRRVGAVGIWIDEWGILTKVDL